ncbi:MAG: SDR family oxidoreductase [bacterium]
MKVLVTGGAGFIGSHLAERLLDEGHEVVVLDDFSTGRRANLESFGDRIRLVEGSIVEPEVCAEACAGTGTGTGTGTGMGVGVEVVFHQAAIPSVPLSVDKPLASHATNATGTLNMLVAAKDAGARRFVYATSASVYGDSPAMPKVETMRADPQSPYATQKHLGELYCANFQRLFGLETVALRYFNIFGPRQDPDSPYGAVVPKFFSALLADQRPLIFGDGEQSRDFAYVDNAVFANLCAARAPVSATGQVYNIACGRRHSVNELLAVLKEILGSDLEAEYRETRAGDVKHSHADIDLARRELGYEVQVHLREGLERTAAWYQQQR